MTGLSSAADTKVDETRAKAKKAFDPQSTQRKKNSCCRQITVSAQFTRPNISGSIANNKIIGVTRLDPYLLYYSAGHLCLGFSVKKYCVVASFRCVDLRVHPTLRITILAAFALPSLRAISRFHLPIQGCIHGFVRTHRFVNFCYLPVHHTKAKLRYLQSLYSSPHIVTFFPRGADLEHLIDVSISMA